MMKIKRSEWLWVIIFAALVMIFTSIPYLVGALRSDDAWRFSGFVIGVEDGNSYLAKMQLGAHGKWLFQLSYAVEDHPASFVYFFFILLGKVFGAIVGNDDTLRLHDALVVGYHSARIVFGFALILVTYRFLAELLPRRRQRRLALIVATLGGGLGWLLLTLPNAGQPLEFYSPEAFSFLHLYSLPHLSAVRALMLSGLLFYLWAVRGRWQWVFAAGGAWFVMTLIQPFYMLIVFILLALHVSVLTLLSFRQGEGELTHGVDLGGSALRALWVSALAGSFGVPLVAYTLLLFAVEPIYQAWSAQNTILSPPAWHYLSAWGLMFGLGLFGLRSLYRRNPIAWALVLGWLIVIPILLYIPYNLQRRFAEGIFVPLAGLAVYGVTAGFGKGRLRRLAARYGPLMLIALALPATGLVWTLGLMAALQPQAPAFQARDQAGAYVFLGKNLPPRAVVLSTYKNGNAIPAYGYLVAYVGHGPETPNPDSKLVGVTEFFDASTLDHVRRGFYDGTGVPYVLLGPAEGGRPNFDPTRQAPYLQMIFQAGNYSVWSLNEKYYR